MLELNQNIPNGINLPTNANEKIDSPPLISSDDALASESPLLVSPNNNVDLDSEENIGLGLEEDAVNSPPGVKKRSRLKSSLLEFCEQAEIAANDSKVYVIGVYRLISKKVSNNLPKSSSKNFKKIGSSKNRDRKVRSYTMTEVLVVVYLIIFFVAGILYMSNKHVALLPKYT